MASPVDFEGRNFLFNPPVGDQGSVSPMPCFTNGRSVVTCWELSDQELADIIRTRRVYSAIMCGDGNGQYAFFPAIVGARGLVREVVLQTGPSFERSDTEEGPLPGPMSAAERLANLKRKFDE